MSSVTSHAQTIEPAQLLDRLVAAYPAFLEGHENGVIVWHDGTRMGFSDRTTGAVRPDPTRAPGKSSQRDLMTPFAVPSLEDMFYWAYPAGPLTAAPEWPADPGRIRVEAFFTKMYGDCRKGEVEKHLAAVAWLPRKRGGIVRMTRVNGVAARLAAVSRELDALPARFDVHLKPSAGTYHCRAIAGTTRASAHGTGSAIDLAPRHAHYWRWNRPDADGRHPYRNAMPAEIVDIFERHGFIWGGKWAHYDTMHFEYRPELLAPAPDAGRHDPAPVPAKP